MVCRCNVEVRVLFNDRATAVVYYKLKYATTAQQEVEPGTADVLAQFEKKLLAEKADGPLQDVDTATRRVLSMAYSSSSRMQVPAPLAAMLVLGYPGKICSHSFGCLLLAQALQRMHGESISGVLRLRTQRRLNGDVVGDGLDGKLSRVVGSRAGSGEKSRVGGGKTVREVVAVDSFTEYACRPTVLSSLNWYKFVEVWKQVKLPPSVVAADLSRRPAVDADDLSDASTDEDPAERSSTMRYLEEHPLYHSHGLRRRRQRCVPRIYGPRLPDRELLVDADQQGTYGMIALLLFAPWRSRDDLVAEGESWWAAYARTVFDSASKWTSCSPGLRPIMRPTERRRKKLQWAGVLRREAVTLPATQTGRMNRWGMGTASAMADRWTLQKRLAFALRVVRRTSKTAHSFPGTHWSFVFRHQGR